MSRWISTGQADRQWIELLETWHDVFPAHLKAMNENRITPERFEWYVNLLDEGWPGGWTGLIL